MHLEITEVTDKKADRIFVATFIGSTTTIPLLNAVRRIANQASMICSADISNNISL